MAEIITMSSKGQIVVPKELREEMKIDEGTNFAIFGKDDTLILKKIEVPRATEVFERIHKWGTELAKKKGWKEEDFIKKANKEAGNKIAKILEKNLKGVDFKDIEKSREDREW